jgi:hypothetical protein
MSFMAGEPSVRSVKVASCILRSAAQKRPGSLFPQRLQFRFRASGLRSFPRRSPPSFNRSRIKRIAELHRLVEFAVSLWRIWHMSSLPSRTQERNHKPVVRTQDMSIQSNMNRQEKLRRIQFRLQDRLQTVRAGIESYSEQLENAEAKSNDHLIRHNREIIGIFEAEEKEMIAMLEIAESDKG